MEICNINYTCNAQIKEKSSLNSILIKAFTNYICATSKWIFLESDCNSTSNKFDIGRLIHK